MLFTLALSLLAHASEPALSGWDAFSALQTGNMRFYEGRGTHQHQDPARREELSTGQKPHTIVISCSDSRVGPEVIFDQGLGDLFVIRVAGNVVGTDAIASAEYAIEHLGSRLLLVMGHESCGAVKAAVGAKPGVSNGSESLDELVKHIRGHISAPALSSTDPTFRQPVKENVSATLQEILKRSPIVAEAVEKKGLILAQGVYSLKTGRVEFWNVGAKPEGAKTESATMPAPATVKKKKPVPAPASVAVEPVYTAPRIIEQNVQEEIIPAVAPAVKKPKKLQLLQRPKVHVPVAEPAPLRGAVENHIVEEETAH